MKRTSSVLDSSDSPTHPSLLRSFSLTDKKDDTRCQERLGFINQRLTTLQNPFLKEKAKEIQVMQKIQSKPQAIIRADTLPATTTTNNSSQVSFQELQSKIFNLSLSLGDTFIRHANISATMSAQPKTKPAFSAFSSIESQQTPLSFHTQNYEESPQLEVERKLVFTQGK